MKRFFKNPISKLRGTRRALFVSIDEDSTKISGAELREILNVQLKSANGEQFQILLLDDADYFMPDKKRVQSFLSSDGTKHFVFTSEGGDCDNFARILGGRAQELCMLCDCKRGIALGTAQGSIYMPSKDSFEGHMLNIVVLSDQSVWLIEPQSGTLYKQHPSNNYEMISI